MKRIILSILLLLGCAFSFGQGKGIKIGVYVDPMISWFSSESRTASSDGAKMGVDGGLVVDNYFQDNYAFHTGIGIGTCGGSILYTDARPFLSYGLSDTIAAGSVVDYKINYLTLPLGLKLTTKEIGYFSYFARLGFTNQFNLKTRATSSDGMLTKSVVEQEIFFYNLSYFVGAGIQYHINKDAALDFAVTYSNGFINLSRIDELKFYSRSVTLRVGIIF
ncbi:MAG: outer membrane beta-barrel protein [Bacteroidales bacterium]|nr:outer membrane beta-barrel protein [Bacteroidales bacterium]